MNTKEIKITVPEGYEIDKENSTFECIKFKKKVLTYTDVARKLFQDKKTYYLNSAADIDAFIPKCGGIICPSNATSQKQLHRLLAINKLMNVAEYLNEGWKPDWKDVQCSKWYIYWNYCQNKFGIDLQHLEQSVNIYFKTPDLALQAIEILGEEEVKLALGV